MKLIDFISSGHLSVKHFYHTKHSVGAICQSEQNILFSEIFDQSNSNHTVIQILLILVEIFTD